jgi:hypothetical protein
VVDRELFERAAEVRYTPASLAARFDSGSEAAGPEPMPLMLNGSEALNETEWRSGARTPRSDVAK